MKRVHKIFSVLAVGVLIAAFMGSMVLAKTGNPADVNDVSTKYIVGTGSISKIGDYAILDSNGQDYYNVELDPEFQKVGLDVYYAGYATGNVLELSYIEAILFDYTHADSHSQGIIKASGTGDGISSDD